MEKFKGRLDNTHTSLYSQGEGVQQGSILSPNRFTIQVNSKDKALPACIEKLLYVDGLAIYFKSSSMNITQRDCKVAWTSLYL